MRNLSVLGFYWAVALFGLLGGFRLNAESPRMGDFLPVDKAFAEALSQAAHTAVEPGMYLSDVKKSLLDASLRPPRFTPILTHSARYLFESPEMEALYGQKVWEYRGSKQISQPTGGEVAISAVDESLLSAGWVANEGGRGLWVVRPNGEAWLLIEEQGGAVRSNRLFPFFPRSFAPFETGVVAFTAEGKLHWKPFAEPLVGEFLALDFESKKTAREFVVASQSGKLLFAARAGTGKLYFLCADAVHPEWHELFALDTKTGAVESLLKRIRGPFSLGGGGISYQLGGKIRHRVISTAGGTTSVGSSSPPDTASVSAEPVGSAPVLDDALLKRLGEIANPVDLLNQIRVGKWRPVYGSPALSQRLNETLGRTDRDTLALLPYQNGAMPLEALAAYFQQLDIRAMGVPAPLQGLKHVFLVRPGKWLEPSALRQSMEVFRQVAERPGVLLLFADFPSPLVSKEQKMTPDLVEAMAARMGIFREVFGSLVSAGKARAVITTRQEIIEALAVSHAHLFEGVPLVEIPTLSSAARRVAMRNLIARTELEFPKVRFSEPAAEEVFAVVSGLLDDPRSGTQGPGLFDSYLLGMAAKASFSIGAGEPRFEITKSFALEYEKTALRRWKLESMPDPEKPGEEVLIWTHPDDPPRPIDPQLLASWKADRSRLTYDDRYPFAVMKLPKEESTAVASRLGIKLGQTILFRPEHPMKAEALNFVPSLVSPHSRGFFFLYEDNKELTLCSYRAAKPEAGELASVKVMYSGIDPDEFRPEKVQVHFERDSAVLDLAGRAIRYNAAGEEVPNP